METRAGQTHDGVDEDGLGVRDDLGDPRVLERLRGNVQKVSGCFTLFQIRQPPRANHHPVADNPALPRHRHAPAPVQRVALDHHAQRHELTFNLRDQQLRPSDGNVGLVYSFDVYAEFRRDVRVVQLAAQHHVVRFFRDRLDAPHLGIELAPRDDREERPNGSGQRGEGVDFFLHEQTCARR